MNYHLYRLSLRGIGILNSEGNGVTGESSFFVMLKKLGGIQTIVDVGANTGGYALELMEYLPNARIYAIEPHPETSKRLQKNTQHTAIEVRTIGFSNKEERGTLWDFALDAELKHTQPTSTLASIHKDIIEDFHKQKSMSYDIRVTTLDAFARKEKIKRIDLLKIDTEGNEYAVLQGAKQLLSEQRIGLIQFEFNEMNVYRRVFFKDFVDLLPGYVFYRLMPRGLLYLGPYRPSTWEIFAFQNILAVPEAMKKRIDML